MKVEEAKTKWCLYMAMLNAINEGCIAEKCMAWRWVDEVKKDSGYCGMVGKDGAE